MSFTEFPSKLLENAVNEFSSLPGIGRKTAFRLVMNLLKRDPEEVKRFGDSILSLHEGIHYCRECHNISDTEICSICSDGKRDRTIICVVENIQDVMAIVARETFTSTSAPIQYAAISAFQKREEIDQYLYQVKRILRSIGKKLIALFETTAVDVLAPHGGFYLFPDFKAYGEKLQSLGITTSYAFCEHLLKETGIAILPGMDFGRAPEELTARLAYVNFDGKEALEAAAQVPASFPLDDNFLYSHCAGPVVAVEKLCKWLKSL